MTGESFEELLDTIKSRIVVVRRLSEVVHLGSVSFREEIGELSDSNFMDQIRRERDKNADKLCHTTVKNVISYCKRKLQ